MLLWGGDTINSAHSIVDNKERNLILNVLSLFHWFLNSDRCLLVHLATLRRLDWNLANEPFVVSTLCNISLCILVFVVVGLLVRPSLKVRAYFNNAFADRGVMVGEFVPIGIWALHAESLIRYEASGGISRRGALWTIVVTSASIEIEQLWNTARRGRF